MSATEQEHKLDTAFSSFLASLDGYFQPTLRSALFLWQNLWLFSGWHCLENDADEHWAIMGWSRMPTLKYWVAENSYNLAPPTFHKIHTAPFSLLHYMDPVSNSLRIQTDGACVKSSDTWGKCIFSQEGVPSCKVLNSHRGHKGVSQLTKKRWVMCRTKRVMRWYNDCMTTNNVHRYQGRPSGGGFIKTMVFFLLCVWLTFALFQHCTRDCFTVLASVENFSSSDKQYIFAACYKLCGKSRFGARALIHHDRGAPEREIKFVWQVFAIVKIKFLKLKRNFQ